MQGYSRPRLAVAAVAASAASLGGLAFGATSAHAASTITVGPGGTYGTIAAGLQHANAGDTVTVAAGTYNETLNAKAGVTIVAAAGGAQVNNIVVSGAAGAVVDGFKVVGFHGTAIKVANSDGAVIKNSSVTTSGLPSDDTTLVAPAPVGSNGTPAVTLSGKVTFQNNHVFGNVYHGVFTSGSAGSSIIGNEIDHNADTNVDTAARFASGISVKSQNVLVSGNYSHDNQDSGIQFYGGVTGGDNGTAVNNVVANNHDHGIDNLNVTGGKILNNTVFHNETAGINVEGQSGSYTVENNISADNGFPGTAANRSKGDIRIANDATTSTTVNHNLVYNSFQGAQNTTLYVWDTLNITGQPVGSGVDHWSQTPADLQSFANQGANDKAGNPGFLSASDFHIAANSPAAGLADQTVAGFPGKDKDGNTSNGSAGAYNAGSTGGPGGGGGTPPPGTGPLVKRLSGGTRFETGTAVSQAAFPTAGSAHNVIIATGWKFPDALSGVPLAKKLNAPLLLVDSNNPAGNDGVKNEIARVLASGGTVNVLGGTAAVPDTVVNAVLPAGAHVQRIAGATRFETSVAIAHALGDPKNVVVARGDDGVNLTGFADALSAGPYAANVFAGGNGAVLLSSNTTLDPAVKTYLAGATSVQAVGGPAATAVGTGANVKAAIVGGDRYETAAKVASNFSGEKTAGVAYGLKFPDALTGAALLADADGPLLLAATDSVTDPTKVQLAGIGQALGTQGVIYVFGGTAVISEVGRTAIATASGGHLN